MIETEIEALPTKDLSGARTALNPHFDGIERALATHLEAMDRGVTERLADIEHSLAALEAGR